LRGFSLTPQFDLSGKVAPGCKLYIIQAGTTSAPQNAYQDTGLTQVLPNPLTCDAAARLPQWFVADGSIKLRLTDKNGTQIFVGDNLLVVGPSSGGGGGGGTVDPTTIMQPCDIKTVYGTGVLTGFVRANGRTIGNASSGASERANADTQALFACLYNADPNLAVSGGRVGGAAVDFAANKTIALPDWRGRAIAGLADMGNTATSALTSTYAGCTVTSLGALCGNQSYALTTPNLPPYTPSGLIGGSFSPGSFWGGSQNVYGGGTNGGPLAQGTITISGASFSFTGTAQGGTSTPFAVVQPTILATIYLKL
jgi:hypothetical protein